MSGLVFRRPTFLRWPWRSPRSPRDPNVRATRNRPTPTPCRLHAPDRGRDDEGAGLRDRFSQQADECLVDGRVTYARGSEKKLHAASWVVTAGDWCGAAYAIGCVGSSKNLMQLPSLSVTVICRGAVE